jgi:kynurenine formamidase
MEYKLISYILGEQTVMPGVLPMPKLRAVTRMCKCPEGFGKTDIRWESFNNVSFLEICTHAGTHIDVPFHIDPEGLTVDAVKISDFIFDNPLFIECPKNDYEKITEEDLIPYEKQLAKSDFLLIYTTFSKYRQSDPKRYKEKQPGFSVDAAKYLMGNFSLKGLGIDVLGIENIDEARKLKPPFPAHRILLKNHRRFILLEDANLAILKERKIYRLYVIPLMVEGAEASPVTAFAEVE